ncbi:sugar ABC transporter ATP-binding protein [Carboxydochorda subterranea]|uniref:Sugar ABC transporter ATP-binding protein n=1 Tax=Carboxydichorda subterranea TaxID=3109565 RepID=A0ABZ1BW79_9FIRM|nr:sugar ABC transporter ATP-binding protein [Limnochorda sp. L945t]WRP17044.1 sugar ABC transporter ATP-binding protein [Limnochorda sp. L945t]
MPHLEAVGIEKRFGGVVALQGASFECRPGEVHALLGANGSGKSTLAKILTGVVAPDAGVVKVDGRQVSISGPSDMYRLGIAAVYQELSLVPQLSVAENILLGHERVRHGLVDEPATWRLAAECLEPFTRSLGRRLPLHLVVAELSPAEQQMVEIAKALSRRPRLLILDEATASLRSREVDALFEVVRRLRAEGSTVVFISHRLEEVYRVCDRATVLRNGQTAATVSLSATTPDDLLRLMVGDVEAPARQPRLPAAGPQQPVLRVEQLVSGRVLRGVTLAVGRGEVVGLGGLQGQGQSELLKALFGALPAQWRRYEIDGRPARVHRVADAIRRGVVLIPGNRSQEGLFMPRPILENLTLPSLGLRSRMGLLSNAREQSAARQAVESLEIKVADLLQPVSSLSGGNQQKVVVGKWLLSQPRLLLMDDPTKGVDVRARLELYRSIEQMRASGLGVLLNSSDDTELLTLCDRVLVMYEGQIVDELRGERLTGQELVAAGLRLVRGERVTSGG